MLALVCHLLGLAALFLLLRAEFVAAAQVIVYAGAVMVLYVFVVAYVGGPGPSRCITGRRAGGCARSRLLFAGALLVEIGIAVDRLGRERARWDEGAGFLPRLRLARGRSASCS